MAYHNIYNSLGLSGIRLLSIAPGLPSETIKCTLFSVDNMDQAPTYDAISYVWGTELSEEPIMCNGEKMTVTKNLIEAMRHLRPLPRWEAVIPWRASHDLHSSRNAWRGFATNRQEQQEHSSSLQIAVWIDAICINQQNNAEKANQVRLMDRIYANAATVKVWLGKVNDYYSTQPSQPIPKQPEAYPLVMERRRFHLGQYGRMPVVLAFIAQALRNFDSGENRLATLEPAADHTHRNRVCGFPGPDSEDWATLREFFSNPWFQRIWVVQEVVLAREAIVILGDWQIKWEALGRAAAWFEAYGYALPPVVKYTGDMKDLLPVAKVAATWQMHIFPGKRRPLLRVLRELRGREAKLKVDKVYAAYGLAEETWSPDRLHPLLEPTYDEPIFGKIYQDVVRFLIIEHGDLSALSHAGGIQGVKTAAWPSWVPDWSQEKASAELVVDSSEESPYNASGSEYLTIGDSTDPGCLSLQGIPVDTIRAYGDKLISYTFRHTTYKEEYDFVRSAWSLVAQLAKEGNRPTAYRDKNISRIFVSTLTAGVTDTKQRSIDDNNFLEDAVDWLLKHFKGQIPTSGVGRRWRLGIGSPSDSGRFHEAFTRVCLHRRFFVTKAGLMGIGPETMEESDTIVVLFGGKIPFVVRRLDEGRYAFVGECFVSGLMDGEAMTEWRNNGVKAEIFNLV